MNSVGIPEGAIVPDPKTCKCVWVMLMCNPPKHQLLTKCSDCWEKDEALGNSRSVWEGTDLADTRVGMSPTLITGDK